MKQKSFFIVAVIALGFYLWISSIPSQVVASSIEDTVTPNSTYRFAGPFDNTTLGIGGTVIIDMNISSTAVSGYINFTEDPDVALLCGAGSFSGTRSGDNFQFSFTSFDPDPGCGIIDGTSFNVTGTFIEGHITNGQFSHSSTGQGGTFSAKQTTRYVGSFSTNGYPGTVTIDLATNSTSMVTGYMNFTNNPGIPALCGAGSFRGSLNSNGGMTYDFLSNDPDGGCSFDDGLEFAVSAVLDGFSITNGSYTVVDTGQTGTFSTACGGGNVTNNDDHSSSTNLEYINGSCQEDDQPPSGKIIWPYDTYISPTDNVLAQEPHLYGPGEIIRIEAIANDALSGVYRVEFWLKYDGQWHRIKDEYFPPYEVDFTIPDNLVNPAQLIEIGIHVVDKAGNVAVDPEGQPNGLRYANYREGHGDPGVTENWIPAGNRSYINQRALSSVVVYDPSPPKSASLNGDWQCGGASIAMILRMYDRINGDYTSLSLRANAAFQFSTTNFSAGSWRTNYIWELIPFLQNPANYDLNQNVPLRATWHYPYPNKNYPNVTDGWNIITGEINSGYPLITLTDRNGTLGHYFVVVGYREEGTTRTLIAYDPYGKWKGIDSTPNNYALNNSSDPTSHIGQWVYYDYYKIWGFENNNQIGRLMTIRPTSELLQSHTTFSGTPNSPPDIISDEPTVIGTYEGIPSIKDYFSIYLPLIQE